jgi:hypothetical protein
MKQRHFDIQIFASSRITGNFNNLKQVANLVSNLFTFNLPPVEIKHTQRLLIEFLEGDELGYIHPTQLGQTIYTFRQGFDSIEYSDSSPLNEKVKILTLCAYRCLLILYRHLGLQCSDVELAYTNIIANGFKLSIPLCGGAKLNRKKTNTATVTAHHYLDYALIEVTFSDVSKPPILKKMEIYKTVPSYFIYNQLVKSARWLDNDTFAIFNNTKEFTLTINKDFICTPTYNPKLREKDGIIEEIRFLTKEVLYTL